MKEQLLSFSVWWIYDAPDVLQGCKMLDCVSELLVRRSMLSLIPQLGSTGPVMNESCVMSATASEGPGRV